MKRTKELFEEYREAIQNETEHGLIHVEQPKDYHPILPVIDLNTLTPAQETHQVDFGGTSTESVDAVAIRIGESIKDSILSGTINPLDFMVKKKLLEQALEFAYRNKDVKEMVETEVAKFGKDGAKVAGATIKLGGRKNYVYMEDPTWRTMQLSIRPIQEKMKEQERAIQAAVKAGHPIVDQETGEIKAAVVPAPETSFVTVTFKK